MAACRIICDTLFAAFLFIRIIILNKNKDLVPAGLGVCPAATPGIICAGLSSSILVRSTGFSAVCRFIDSSVLPTIMTWIPISRTTIRT